MISPEIETDCESIFNFDITPQVSIVIVLQFRSIARRVTRQKPPFRVEAIPWNPPENFLQRLRQGPTHDTTATSCNKVIIDLKTSSQDSTPEDTPETSTPPKHPRKRTRRNKKRKRRRGGRKISLKAQLQRALKTNYSNEARKALAVKLNSNIRPKGTPTETQLRCMYEDHLVKAGHRHLL